MFCANKSVSSSVAWLIDSGASIHMTKNMELLSDYQELEKSENVRLGDGRTVDAIGIGNVHIEMLFKVSEPKKSVMYKVLYVPQLSCNLFSVRAAASKGNFIRFGRYYCWIRGQDQKLCGMGTLENQMYRLDCKVIKLEISAGAASIVKDNDLDVWHFRLGHANEQYVKKLANSELYSHWYESP